ncbi:hypothetical protein ABZ990_02405 [Streptomyces sp. NPDC046203]|uniref:hypothetical protein n=1 Tax=Streptomyces sp. NPDC046203 TaxID=3154602 RepID=UPI0033E3F326
MSSTGASASAGVQCQPDGYRHMNDRLGGQRLLHAAERRDRERLRGLLDRLVRDRDRPLDTCAPRRVRDAVAEGVN